MILKHLLGDSKKDLQKESNDLIKILVESITGEEIPDIGEKLEDSIKGNNLIGIFKKAKSAYKEEFKSLEDSGVKGFEKLTKSSGSFIKTLWDGIGIVGKLGIAIGAITAAYVFFEKTNESIEETEKKSEAFTESINSAATNMAGNSSTISSLNDEYQKLSKGVSKLGENVSLSADEYDRYKEIVSQVSNIMPSMAGHFNSQGEQIGFTKGKLADLNTEYEKYIQNQAKSFLVKGDENGNTFEDVLNNYNNNKTGETNWWENLKTSIKQSFGIFETDDVATDTLISSLEGLQNKSKDEIADYLNTVETLTSGEKVNTLDNQIKEILKNNLGHSAEEIRDMTDEEFNVLQESIASNIESLKNDKDVDMSQVVSGLLQTAYTKDGYWELEESLRNNVTTILSSINADTWDTLGLKTQTEVSSFVGSLISDISSNKDGIADAWNKLFELDVDKLSAKEYTSKVNEYMNVIANTLGLNEEGKNQFMISLGFDLESMNIKGMRDKIKKVLPELSSKELNKLTLSDLEIAVKVSEDAKEHVKEEAKKIVESVESEMEKLQKGGSVDLLKRPTIDTSKLAEKGYKDVGEGTATVYTNTFSNKDKTVAMNFTPILPDGTVLEEKEFVKYCESVVDGAKDIKGLKIGATFEGKDAIEQAEKVAEKIHKLQEKYYVKSSSDINKEASKNALFDQIDIHKYLGEDAVSSAKDVIDNLGFSYVTLSEQIDKAKQSNEVFKTSVGSYLSSGFKPIDILMANTSMINALPPEDNLGFLGDKFMSDVDDYIAKTNELQIALGKYSDGSLTDNDIKEITKSFEEYDLDKLIEDTDSFDDAVRELLSNLNSDMVAEFEKQFGKIETAEDVRNLEAFMNSVLETGEVVGNTAFSIDIETETAGYESLSAALQESVSATGLSSESIANLKSRYAELEAQGYDLDKMFEETTNGIHLNREEFNKLEEAYEAQKMEGLSDKIDELQMDYDNLTDKINRCNDATRLQELHAKRDAIVAELESVRNLAAQYDGLTSAYNKWQMEQNAGNERDMYEGVLSGFEEVKEEMKRGWFDDDTVAFLELLTGKNISSLPIEKQIDAYERLDNAINSAGYSIQDFFTKNKDGESTSEGVFNFLDTINADKEIEKAVTKHKDGTYSFDFGLVAEYDEDGNLIKNGDEVIAEALGISEELVQIILRAADDAGFTINLEGAYTSLANLRTEAEDANEALKKLKLEGSEKLQEKLKNVDLNFNFDATGEELEDQVTKSEKLLNKFKNKDGKVNLKMEGAQEALEVASYFTAMQDRLNEPVYMKMNTDEVEEEIKEPLEKMQEFETLVKRKHQLELSGNTKELEKTEKEMEKITNYLEKLDEEKKVKLGIEDLEKEELKKKLIDGEIEIPASIELDIQTEMNDNLEEMVLLMKHQAGLITDEELTLQLKYDVDSTELEELDNLTEEEKEVFVDVISDDEALEALEDHYVEIEAFANIFGVEKASELKEKLDGLDNKQIQIITEVLGQTDVEKLKTAMDELEDKDVKAIAQAIGNGSIEQLKAAMDSLEDEEIKAVAEAFGYEDVESLKASMDKLTDKDIQAIAQTFGIKDVDSLKAAVDKLKSKDVKAIAKVDGEKDVNELKDTIEGLGDKEVTIWASIKKKASNLWATITGNGEESEADGTAHAKGTAISMWNGYRSSIGAYAKGTDWTLPRNESALVNEIGTESIVRDGKWFPIPGGAHVEQLKKGDIIFSAAQTEELIRTGKVTSGGGHGRVAYANGTAFNMMNAYDGGSNGGRVGRYTVTGAVTNSGNNSNGNNNNDDAKDSVEKIDWIERAIKKVQRAIENLSKTASATYKKWSTRNKALTKEIGKVNEEIDIQQKAYRRYMEEANSVGLSKKYRKLVQSGKIDIESIKDEKLREKISEYQQWYDKALECKDAVADLRAEVAALAKEKFDNVVSEYDNELSYIEHKMNMIEGKIDRAEAKGNVKTQSYYKDMISWHKKNINKLSEEKKALEAALETAVKEGKIEKYSEDWWAMKNDIYAVEEALQSANTELIETQNNLRQLEWDAFDRALDMLSGVTEESEFLRELMSDEKMFDDTGKITAEGQATLGLHALDYNTYLRQSQEIADEINKINADLAKDPTNVDLLERREQLLDQQREAILAAEQEKQAMKDLMEEGYNAMLSHMDELIDKRKEYLKATKDLYDYEKNVREQTEEIARLEKQLQAYQGDTSEEAKSTIQQLEVDLKEAREQLEETEYEKYISDQEKMLDTMRDDTEEWVNERLDNIDQLIEEVIASTNANSSDIQATLIGLAKEMGYELSDEMLNVWKNSNKDVVSTFEDGDFINELTTTNSTLDKILKEVQNITGFDFSGSSFAKGGTVGGVIRRKTGEDGFLLARTGEEILSLEKIKELKNSFKAMNAVSDSINSLYNLSEIKAASIRPALNPNGSVFQIGDINMYGVNDPATFAVQLRDALKNDIAVKKIIQADTLGVMAGKSGLAKMRY